MRAPRLVVAFIPSAAVMTRIFAHRGCTRDCPENTRSAFATARSCGVDGVEFDVQLSRDSVAMVIHDTRVDRTCNGVGAVSDLTYKELRVLDAGSWFDVRFAGEQFLSLDEVLELIDDQLELNVHLKPVGLATSFLVERSVKALARHGRLRTAYITCDETTLLMARALQPAIRASCLVPHPRNTAAAIDAALAVGSCNMQVGHRQIDEEFVRLAHSRSLPINAMYLGTRADDLDEIRRLISCGVDGLLLDHAETWLAG
jgi:glycerophosphoryl diester phosphodiesterase